MIAPIESRIGVYDKNGNFVLWCDAKIEDKLELLRERLNEIIVLLNDLGEMAKENK
jgi:hypothetical protein